MFHRIDRLALVALAAAVVAVIVPHGSIACDTPVYRYAMYRWRPTSYEMYYFHEDFWQDGKYGENDTATHKAIERLAGNNERPANLILLPVNVFADPQLRSVPPDVRRMWLRTDDQSLPNYMLVSPQGAQVYSGGFNVAELAPLTMSPTRERVAELLADGRSGVFLLLGGSDKDANDAAEKVLNDLATDVAAGKVDLYMGPGPTAGPPRALLQQPTDQEDADSDPPQHEIGVVRLERNDAKEHWLVETLLAIEPDLKNKEFENQPMIFVVYGRARALPPYIGKGITRDNMLDVLAFITSACSCTVKEQNPGVDLLASYDWETAAEKLADRFGTEEGNEGFYAPDEFFPELIVGSDSQRAQLAADKLQQHDTAVAADAAPSSDAVEFGSTADTGTARTDTKTAEQNTRNPDPVNNGKQNELSQQDRETERSQESPQIAALSTNSAASPAEATAGQKDTRSSNTWIYTLGIGIGIALFMLTGASFVLLQNR